MKITYLSSSTIPSRTANSIHVMKMCQAFAKNGHEVVLIAPDSKDDLEPGVEDIYAYYGVEKCFDLVKCFNPGVKGQRFIYAWRAAREAKLRNSDIVYGRNYIACAFAARMGLPTIFESHLPVSANASFFDKIFKTRPWEPGLARIVVISKALENYYSERYPEIKEKIKVIPDAADAVSPQESFHPHRSDNFLNVGYAGHLYKGKSMEIISNLAVHCPWARFHIIGGTDKDIEFWQNMLEGYGNIIFYGFLPPSEVGKTLAGLDVLLAPFQTSVSSHGKSKTDIGEWFSPLKIFEYMAAGKPIVCSDLPVLREVLVHKQNALLCPPEDMSAWVEALMRLEKDSALRESLSQKAYKDFLNNYTWQARAKKAIDGFERF